MVLDVKRLRVFREVARQGSFSAAALALEYSQPAISHHIRRLEGEVGALLIERRNDGHGLTEAGAMLLTHAEEVIDRLAEAEAELEAAITTSKSRVRLGAFASASATFVPKAIAVARRQHPEAGLTLVEGEQAETLGRLQEREIDVAVVFDHPGAPLSLDNSLEFDLLFNDPLDIVLSQFHPASRAPRLTLNDLRDQQWIAGATRGSACSLILFDACRRAGFEPNIAFSSGNYHVVQRLVAAGVGVALVPRLALDTLEPGLVARPTVEPSRIARRVGIVTRRGGFRAAAVQAVLDELRAAASTCGTPLSDAQAAHA